MPLRIKNAIVSIMLLMTATVTSGHAATFSMQRGLNMDIWVTWPDETRWGQIDVILPWPEWRRTIDQQALAGLREAGFDTLRIPFDPAVFLSSRTASLHDRLYASMLETVREINGAGLKAIVDLHLVPRGDTGLGMEAVLGDPKRFADYLEIVRRTAQTIAGEDPAMVALELMNEPGTECDPAGVAQWSGLQRQLFAAARASAPRLTIVLTGGCGGSAEGLVALDPGLIPDDNVMWSFHSYRPFLLTHQGAQWAGDFIRYVTGLTYPPHEMSDSARDAALAAIRERIRAEAPWTRRAGMLAYLDEQYAEVGTAQSLRNVIEEPFRMVADWAKRHGIAPGNIVLGEFGIIRQEWENPTIMPAASRAAYTRDIIELAERYGYPWAMWGHSGAFGVVDAFNGQRAEPDVLDVVRALPPAGLRP